MKKIAVKDMTIDNFKIYGSFSSMINPLSPKLGIEPVEFYRDMEFLELGGHTTAAFSVTHIQTRPMVIDTTELHSFCAEAILPLDGDVLIHVAPATQGTNIPYDQIEVFRVPRGTLVTLRPGVWHHAPYTDGCECVNILTVLPERTYANDCNFYSIPEDARIEIETI